MPYGNVQENVVSKRHSITHNLSKFYVKLEIHNKHLSILFFWLTKPSIAIHTSSCIRDAAEFIDLDTRSLQDLGHPQSLVQELASRDAGEGRFFSKSSANSELKI